MYISTQLILESIQGLSEVHPFIGLTFLTCKRHNLPVGTAVSFRLDAETKSFMERVNRLSQGSQYFYQPFKTNDRRKKWITQKYPSSGLQAINTQTFRSAFIHPKKSHKWGWNTNYIDNIKAIVENKTPLVYLAIWTLKDEKWSDSSTISHVVERFLSDFHLTKDEIDTLFDTQQHITTDKLFQDMPVTWNELSLSLALPPDAGPNRNGTISSLELKNVGPVNDIKINFGDRLNIITGDNGLGKTFIIDCSWWALTSTWINNPACPKKTSKKSRITYSISNRIKNVLSSTYNATSNEWPREKNTLGLPGLIVYARVDGSYAIWDPIKDKINSQQLLLNHDEVWNGVDTKIEGLFRDWVKWQILPEKYPFGIFKKVLEVMSPPDLGVLSPGYPVRIFNNSKEIPTITHPYGTVPIIQTSAGVRRIITLAYLMVWAWEEHKINATLQHKKPDSRMVVMVDELEAHLHPKWQRTILPALTKIQGILSDELDIQFIVTTHSPLVLASIEPFFREGQDKLFHMNLETNGINARIEELDFIRYGQVNSWLTSPIFNMKHARSKDAEIAIEKAKDIQSSLNYNAEEIQHIHDKLIETLAADDPFWPRWIYFVDKYGKR